MNRIRRSQSALRFFCILLAMVPIAAVFIIVQTADTGNPRVPPLGISDVIGPAAGLWLLASIVWWTTPIIWKVFTYYNIGVRLGFIVGTFGVFLLLLLLNDVLVIYVVRRFYTGDEGLRTAIIKVASAVKSPAHSATSGS